MGLRSAGPGTSGILTRLTGLDALIPASSELVIAGYLVEIAREERTMKRTPRMLGASSFRCKTPVAQRTGERMLGIINFRGLATFLICHPYFSLRQLRRYTGFFIYPTYLGYCAYTVPLFDTRRCLERDQTARWPNSKARDLMNSQLLNNDNTPTTPNSSPWRCFPSLFVTTTWIQTTVRSQQGRIHCLHFELDHAWGVYKYLPYASAQSCLEPRNQTKDHALCYVN